MNIFDAESALIEAIEESDLRPIQKLRLRLALRFRPMVRAEMLGAVQMHCVMQGVVTEAGEVQAAIDWKQVIDIIIQYLPTLLSLLLMFI